MKKNQKIIYSVCMIIILLFVHGCSNEKTTKENDQNTQKNEIIFSRGMKFRLENNIYRITEYSGENQIISIPKQINGIPVTIIDTNAFSHENISSVTIPNTITKINSFAFSNTELTEVIFEQNSSLATIGYFSFANNSKLDKIHIPKSVLTIEPGAFQQSLYEISFEPNSQLKTIGEYAFYGSGIQSITIPKSVITIHNRAFNYNQLIRINFEEGSQLQTIGDNAFRGTELITIIIPANVRTIGMNAFFSSRLTKVIFEADSKIKTIGTKAFANNSNLTTFEIPIVTPPEVGSDLFEGVSLGLKIYVPSESVDTYKATVNWSKYLIDSIENK